MRFHRLTEGLLASPARAKVILTLLGSPRDRWSGSALARAAGVTPRWAIDTLRVLEAHGVVSAAWEPPALRWTVNRRHFLLAALSAAARLDVGAQEALAAEIRRLVRPIGPSAVLWFGSTARGDEEPGSDVDVLVVVKASADKARAQETLARAGGPFFWRFGNRLAPLVLTRREFEERRRRPSFVSEAVSGGRWVVGGPADG